MKREPLWLSEHDVVDLMDLAEAIDALETGLLYEARGEADNMTKTHVKWGSATLHAIGAAFHARGFVGTKTWAHTPGGATPLLILFDAEDGSLRAVIEAFALGQLRTGAASGLATRWLAEQTASELAIIGAGRQALAQVAAVAAVRPIERVRVFSPTPARCQALAERLERELGVESVAETSVEAAVAGAAVVTTATRSKQPFLSAAMLAEGAHVNAIGAIVRGGAELRADVIARSETICVDDLQAAQSLSRELGEAVASGAAAWGSVQTLASVVAEGQPRRDGVSLTLFKSLGMGISDLALGIEILERAGAAARGRAFPHPERVAPRLATPTTKREAISDATGV